MAHVEAKTWETCPHGERRRPPISFSFDQRINQRKMLLPLGPRISSPSEARLGSRSLLRPIHQGLLPQGWPGLFSCPCGGYRASGSRKQAREAEVGSPLVTITCTAPKSKHSPIRPGQAREGASRAMSCFPEFSSHLQAWGQLFSLQTGAPLSLQDKLTFNWSKSPH